MDTSDFLNFNSFVVAGISKDVAAARMTRKKEVNGNSKTQENRAAKERTRKNAKAPTSTKSPSKPWEDEEEEAEDEFKEEEIATRVGGADPLIGHFTMAIASSEDDD